MRNHLKNSNLIYDKNHINNNFRAKIIVVVLSPCITFVCFARFHLFFLILKNIFLRFFMDLVESTLIIRALRCSILCGRDNETNNFELRQQFFLVSLGWHDCWVANRKKSWLTFPCPGPCTPCSYRLEHILTPLCCCILNMIRWMH